MTILGVMRRSTMSDDGNKAETASGARSDARAPESGSRDDRPMTLDCCGARMGGEMADCSCSAIMRKHPVITSALLALMGLAFVVIPAGAILGIIAFFRTI
jgi:hypothetical protein